MVGTILVERAIRSSESEFVAFQVEDVVMMLHPGGSQGRSCVSSVISEAQAVTFAVVVKVCLRCPLVLFPSNDPTRNRKIVQILRTVEVPTAPHLGTTALIVRVTIVVDGTLEFHEVVGLHVGVCRATVNESSAKRL